MALSRCCAVLALAPCRGSSGGSRSWRRGWTRAQRAAAQHAALTTTAQRRAGELQDELENNAGACPPWGSGV